MALASLNPTELAFCSRASSFLQSDFWGSFKSRFGWKTYSFCADWDTGGIPATGDVTTLPLLVLYRRLGPGIGFAYVPWGPELPPLYNTDKRSSASAELAEALRIFIPKDTALIRFDFPWYIDIDEDNFTESRKRETNLLRKSFTPAAADVQPPDSVFVDLFPDEVTIRASMKSKWRYNIGLAERKGVSIRTVSQADRVSECSRDFESYYRLYKETAERDGISIHGREYYTALFEEALKHTIDLRLYMASHEGDDIAGIVTLFRGEEAMYLYGASSNNKRNLMAPLALQWKAMQDAKAFGCRYYDMYGIPPRPPEEDPRHPMAGLYRFKTGFIGDKGEGGRIVHRPGCWDYSCRPLAKALYSAAEKTRKKIWDVKKQLRRS